MAITDFETWRGIFPATIVPLTEDDKVDEEQLRKLIRFYLTIPGIKGFGVNGHAGDITLLSREERIRILEIYAEETNGKVPLFAGVEEDSLHAYVEAMKDAKAAGAWAIQCMAPASFRGVIMQTPEVPYKFFSDLARAVDIGMMVYQHPIGTGKVYAPHVLAKLTEIGNVCAIKECTWDIKLMEKDLRAMRTAPRRVPMLSAFDNTLFASFCMGCDGVFLGLATLTPHWVIDMYDAINRSDLETARRINDQMFPIVEITFGGGMPGISGHRVMNEALYMLGVLDKPAFSRSPYKQITAEHRAIIKRAIEESGLNKVYARHMAAVKR